jgi:voltage-gated potassium channel
MDDANDRELFAQSTNWIVFVFLIVILTVVDLLFLLLPIDPAAKNVILVVGLVINIIFWIDSFYWLRKLPNRRYLTHYHGRLGFIGNIPFFAPLRLLQLWLFQKQLRKLDIRLEKDVKVSQNSLGVVLLFLYVAIVVFQTASVFVLIFESADPAAEINSSGEALWWSLVTVATVGYGDYVPITNGGRMTALFLMVIGIAMFGIFTSALSDWFRNPRRLRESLREQEDEDRAVTVDEIRQLLEQQNQVYQNSIAELAEKLDELAEK